MKRFFSKEENVMDSKTIEMLKGMSREEKKAYFEKNMKSVLKASELENVNGGTGGDVENPNSEIMAPQYGPWYSSFGYVCDGEKCCG